MAELQQYDMIVIGAGPAGVNAAVTAAMLGKKVVVLEKNAVVGGAGANTGTLPSKTLRETALALSGLKTRRLYGVDLSLRREATVSELMFHEHMVKHAAQAEIIGIFDRSGIPLIHGTGSFIDTHTIHVVPLGGEEPLTLQAEFIVIAIGSAPMRPALFPFDHPRVWDSDEILEITHVPKRLAVIGAGVIGSEYACTFAALEGKVEIIDGRDALLPFLDLEVSQKLQHAMADLGITFHWKSNVISCTATDHEVQLQLDTGENVICDAVLVAAGRASRTELLNPHAAGLHLGKRGLIPVNEHFQTNIPNIYAVGDVVGFPALASTSAEQGRIASNHACGSQLLKGMPPLLPTGIYAIPEVGMIGETEGTLQAHGVEYIVGKAMYNENARGKIIGDDTGFIKLIYRRDDMRLVGVHVIGEQATELVHIGLMAMRVGGGADLFLNTCFNFPTLGNLYKLATYRALVNRYGRLSKVHMETVDQHEQAPVAGLAPTAPNR
ncbi:MAG: Si-specific NAD(P)(+) transhydrogenase [Bacteroidales bacterium]|nr:Si-specific NAD(P)(+) transhydrogenase [Bacteroidales bacterium]